MSTAAHFHLKRASGWFAAGPEVEVALRLLSDAAFKLFVWLCLHADRSCGSMVATPSELARGLRRSEAEIQTTLEELWRQGVCVWRQDGMIEITDRFWPYQRTREPAVDDDQRTYTSQVKQCFLQRRCVRSVFTAADEKLAIQLHRNGVPIVEVERAILLGSLRKCVALINNGGGTPITTLHYFTALFAEVRQEVSDQYWHYVAHKLRTLEQRLSHRPEPTAVATTREETK
jgi:hypothetical protein